MKRSTDMHFLDLRNKFGSLHNQYTTNRERELFSTYDTNTWGPADS